MLLNGRKKSNSNEKRVTKGVKRDVEDDDEEQVEDDNDEEAPDESASASFGRGARNRHNQNPNNKKARTIGALQVVAYKISKTVATPVIHPTDFGIQCRAEIDSRADTICCGKTFRLIELTERIADVSGFHADFGVLNEIPIATCCTAIDHPDL
jgi:hypothetical protein